MRLCVCILVFAVAVLVVLDDVALLAAVVVVVLVAGAEVSISHVVLVVVAVAVDATDEVASAGGGHRERILALLGGLRPLPNPMPTGLGFILVSTLATCQLLLSYSFWAFLSSFLSLFDSFFRSFSFTHCIVLCFLIRLCFSVSQRTFPVLRGTSRLRFASPRYGSALLLLSKLKKQLFNFNFTHTHTNKTKTN